MPHYIEKIKQGMSISILIHGYYGFKNLGDELTLKKIIEDLRLLYPEANLLVLSGDPQYTEATHAIKAVNRFNVTDVIEAVRRCDAFILGSGGLFHDHYPLVIKDILTDFGHGIVSYAIPPLIAKILGKPVFYWAHGVGPLFTTEAMKLTKWAYCLADFVTLRDEYSYRLLMSIGVPKEKLCVDLDPALKHHIDGFIDNKVLNELNLPDNKFLIGVNLRPWKERDDEIVEKVENVLIDIYQREGNVLFLLIPFDISSDHASDIKILRSLSARLPDGSFEVIDKDNMSPEFMLSAISRTHAVIGMRLHFLIYALKLAKPSIALTYDRKVKELFKMLKLDDFSLSLNMPNFKQIADKVFQNKLQQERFDNIANTIDNLEYTTPLRFKEVISDKGHNTQDDVLKTDNGNIYSLMLEDIVTEFSNIRRDKEDLNSRLANTVVEKNALKDQLAQTITEKDSLNSQLNQTIKDKEDLNSRLANTVVEKNALKDQLAQTITEKDSLNSQLNQTIRELSSRLEQAYNTLDLIYSSRTWRLGQLYGKLFRPSKLNKMFESLADRIIPKRDTFQNYAEKKVMEVESITRLQNVINIVNSREKKGVFIVTSAFEFNELYNQRVINLSKFLVQTGYSVIYIAWRWSRNSHMSGLCEEVYPDIFQVPVDYFFDHTDMLTNITHPKKFFIIEFSHPTFFNAMLQLKKAGFITLYDIIDDWEEFNKVNQAPWYEKDYEEAIVINSDVLAAVSSPLIEKFSNLRTDIALIPNGFSPSLLGEERANISSLKKKNDSKIDIGYFGHLTDSWFDWDTVIETAERNKDFIFHFIGYGETEEVRHRISKYNNIILYGEVQPSELCKYAKDWDVAIIPFIKNPLSKAVDPIKIYEYLFLGLPVVVLGIDNDHMKSLPYVQICNDSNEFQDGIRDVVKNRKNSSYSYKEIEVLLRGCSWEKRFTSMLKFLERDLI